MSYIPFRLRPIQNFEYAKAARTRWELTIVKHIVSKLGREYLLDEGTFSTFNIGMEVAEATDVKILYVSKACKDARVSLVHTHILDWSSGVDYVRKCMLNYSTGKRETVHGKRPVAFCQLYRLDLLLAMKLGNE